ncbi:Bug family tripartite tricarboxylate transporter substrate binding protein [Tsukamurella strandjordii]|uniref:Bug family tripartite tricarboxylate transporter substrate binding protein n=1 Tax=Tsukamurella strandjordii TaxID=147577 RepID=UPI003F6ED9D8
MTLAIRNATARPIGRRAFVVGAGLALAGASSACGRAGDGAPRDLRFMVPHSPGGGYDLTARTAARTLEDTKAVARCDAFNVIGSGGTVAMARLMNERGNGSLIMMMGLGVIGACSAVRSTYRATDATPLARLIDDQEGIVVPAESRFRTVDDFLSAWRQDPGGVRIGGGSFTGGPDHLFPMELARTLGIDPARVDFSQYSGGGDLLTALLGRRVDAAVSGTGEYRSQIAGGGLRVLAVSGRERVPGIDAPTLREAGVDLTFNNWRGVLAPPGITPGRRRALVDMLARMRSSPQWQEALRRNGWTDEFSTGTDFEKFLAQQEERVAKALRDLGRT